jgi:ubiquinone/menaquinone biosynthesis C-methylase UbiE
MKEIYLKLLSFFNRVSDESEDREILKFLNKENDSDCKKLYLEVGSGLGRFVTKVSNLFHFDITAIEINADLAERTRQMGVNTLNINFLDNQFTDNQFDIVHCSHVIEHIPYPAIINFLDELLRITKPGGHVIIRSPLMSTDFYTDIDHIRPYPPKTILNYYSNPQQQITGKYSIVPVHIRLRRSPLLINGYSYNPIIRAINMFFKLLWCFIRFPFSKPSGYIAIFKKMDN